MQGVSDRPAMLIKRTPAQAEGCNSTSLKSMANFPLIFNKGGFAERTASVGAELGFLFSGPGCQKNKRGKAVRFV